MARFVCGCCLQVQVVQLLEDFSMVHFTTLDISDEESIEALLQSIDMAIQVGSFAWAGRVDCITQGFLGRCSTGA